MSESDQQGSSKHRLLVVDDSKEVTDILEEVGIDVGYQVRSVNEFDLIIPQIKQFDPTVIFLDLNLDSSEDPETGEIPREGLEILKYLSAATSRVDIVIVSGLSRRTRELNQLMGRDLNLHMVGSIPKPFDIKNVEEVLLKL
ncbi:MAG: response regulator [Gammaproteobacteria bacterium]|jgi:CheY-like chemotaxis protein|nr:response regulator [Gammaproteobacteria bacterium]|tara:strand:- start:424 stop:849 length:426 start_codon:yes stop_codon:yes gene_type:complete